MSEDSEDYYEKISFHGIDSWSHDKKGQPDNKDVPDNDNFFKHVNAIKILLSVAGILVAVQVALAVAMVASVRSEAAGLVQEWHKLNHKAAKNSTTEVNVSIVLDKMADPSQLPSITPNATNTPRQIFNERMARLNDEITNLSSAFSHKISSSIVQIKAFIFDSCSDILRHSLPSGYYLVRTSNQSIVNAYCDMTLSCGEVKGGWTRAIREAFPDPVNGCPSGFIIAPLYDTTFCARGVESAGCTVINYSMRGMSYSRVCGRVTGAQFRTSDGFIRYKNYVRLSYNDYSLNSTYLDGISLTHGDYTHHIWSLVALQKDSLRMRSCSLDKPAFVGSHYSCDEQKDSSSILWDGLGCSSPHNQEWFYRNLSYSTSDGMEVRLCRDEQRNNEDVLIKTLEIYIQ